MHISGEGKLGIALGLVGIAGGAIPMIAPTYPQIGWLLMVISIGGLVMLACHHWHWVGAIQSLIRRLRGSVALEVVPPLSVEPPTSAESYVLLRQAVDYAISKIEPQPGHFREAGFDAQAHFARGLIYLAGTNAITLFHRPDHGIVEMERVPQVDVKLVVEELDFPGSSFVSRSSTPYRHVSILRNDLDKAVKLMNDDVADRFD